MKIKIEFEGDYYDDFETMEQIVHAREMYSTLTDIDLALRNRIKHSDDITPSEEAFLRSLRNDIHECGISF